VRAIADGVEQCGPARIVGGGQGRDLVLTALPALSGPYRLQRHRALFRQGGPVWGTPQRTGDWPRTKDAQGCDGRGTEARPTPGQVAGQEVILVGVGHQQRLQVVQLHAKPLRCRDQVGATIEQQIVVDQRGRSHTHVAPTGLSCVGAGGTFAKGGRDTFRCRRAQE